MYINIYIYVYIYVDLKRLVKIVVQLALIMVKIVIYVADTGRKRTLFHSKWANLISHISRMLY